MSSKKFSFSEVLFLVVLSALLVSTITWAQWAEPTVGPPNQNIIAPLNTGGVGQVKKYIDATNKGWLGVATDNYDSNYGFTVGYASNKLGIKVRGNSYLQGATSDSGSAALNITNDVSTNLLYVRNDGNVGIGTAAPGYKLDVQGGNINVSGVYYKGGTAGASPTACGAGQTFSGITVSGGIVTSAGSCTSLGGGTVTGSGSANRATFWTSGTNISYDANFAWDNTNKRLGIANSAPAYPLDVTGDVRWTGTLQGGTVPWSRISGFAGDTTPDTIADDGTISSAEITDLTIATADIANLAVTNAKISEMDWTKLQNYPVTCGANEFVRTIGDALVCETDQTGAGLQGGGTVNYVGKFTGTGTIGNSQIFDNGTDVGIGTPAPSAKLEVSGGPIKATGGLIIETRTSDPASPAVGQMWLRTDL